MLKIILLLFCIFSLGSAGFLDLLISLAFKKNVTPMRVRTLEERDRRRMNNESAVLDFIGLVEQYDGYKAEEYSVTTDDGYILGLHRISASPLSPKAEGKPVVYIQHGLFSSSDFMVVLSPKQALAYQLADAGYDVWLGNVRGNTYSKAHVNYISSDSDFWDFRMDEMGLHDLSTFIDEVLKKTGEKKLTYIGYSMGTTLSYMLLSSKPEYNDKVNLVVSIAPVSHFKMSSSIFIKGVISAVLTANKFSNEIFPQSAAVGDFARESCSDSNSMNPCKIFLASFLDIDNLNASAIPDLFDYTPAGTSYYTLQHYKQLMDSEEGKFQKYDYPCGFWHPFCLNKEKYNQTTAPEYDVSKVTAPNAIFYSQNDIFVNVEDVQFLKSKLPNVVALEEVADEKFNHLDFAWSTKARDLVYNRILDIMSKNL